MCISSVQFSRLVRSDSLRPHELQHARPPCPSSQWCHPAIYIYIYIFWKKYIYILKESYQNIVTFKEKRMMIKVSKQVSLKDDGRIQLIFPTSTVPRLRSHQMQNPEIHRYGSHVLLKSNWLLALPHGTQLQSDLRPCKFLLPRLSKNLQPNIPWQPIAHLPQGNCRDKGKRWVRIGYTEP